MNVQEKNNQALADFTTKEHTYLELSGKGPDQHLIAVQRSWLGRFFLWIRVKFGCCSSARLDKIAKYITDQMHAKKLQMPIPEATQKKLLAKISSYNKHHSDCLKNEYNLISLGFVPGPPPSATPQITKTVPPANIVKPQSRLLNTITTGNKNTSSTKPTPKPTTTPSKPATPAAKVVPATTNDLTQILSSMGIALTPTPSATATPKPPSTTPSKPATPPPPSTTKPATPPPSTTQPTTLPPPTNVKPLVNAQLTGDPNEPTQEEIMAMVKLQNNQKPQPKPKTPPTPPSATTKPATATHKAPPKPAPSTATTTTNPPANTKPAPSTTTTTTTPPVVAAPTTAPAVINMTVQAFTTAKAKSFDEAKKVWVDFLQSYNAQPQALDNEGTFKGILYSMSVQDIEAFAKDNEDPLFIGDNYGKNPKSFIANPDQRLGIIYDTLEVSDELKAFIKAKIAETTPNKSMLNRLIHFFGKMDETARGVGFDMLIDILSESKKMGAYLAAIPGFIQRNDASKTDHPVYIFGNTYFKHLLQLPEAERNGALNSFEKLCTSLIKVAEKQPLSPSENTALLAWRDFQKHGLVSSVANN